ncbi:putative membrane protein [Acinetobacter baumannii 44327_8]|nr:putative membrane protein [Acinetobacter baumannii 400834]EXF08332.1 putative membrane protein [Acinetobacter baumannii 1575710]EXW44879.1 putative membrane protein [Acinetobacter baumannii 44467_9]EXW53289.1 putative membrane protein [Acinetobacter baumannii 44467_8]EXW64906.1 putative membrane protein [Acinetobacter baumannii 44467_6]EXW65514.1 putative membrane protein [Acinetobacter baumannii 44467_5]EXW71049.1 putative membrane protein [Acinetobacter baumannii 44467_4]EXW73607.1 puta
MGFKFSLITSIITVLGILLVLIGLYWYKSKKYQNDLWVQNVGQKTFYIGLFLSINGIGLSIKLNQ